MSISFKEWKRPFEGVDLLLFFTVLSLVTFGLIMVYSASFIYAQERAGDGFAFIKKQIVVAAMGFVALWGAMGIPYQKWAKWSYPILAIVTLLLALVLVPGIGARVGGAQRWIRLGPINFQPGELAKFGIIIFVSAQLHRKLDRLHKFAAGFLSNFLIPLPALLLLLAQPDFGTTVMVSLVIFALMFLAGVPKRYLFTSLVMIGTAGAWLVLSSSYRRTRLLGFMDPWSDPGGKGFQIIQSLLGLYNGQVWGTGLGNSKEKLFYLPEAHNDFIFAVIGEELGFLGVACVVAAYLYFIYRGLKIALQAYQRDSSRFALLLATGITLALGFQGFVNMAVVLGLLPTKGLTLPFISYGGSALMIDLFAVGILLNISRSSRHA